jgi:hypothetical protein
MDSYRFWAVSSWILYYSSMILVTVTDQSGLMIFKYGNCFGLERLSSSPSGSSNYYWTVSAVRMEVLLSWRTASFFRNNIGIMGYTWLPNLSTYFRAVTWSRRAKMGPTEYHDTAAQTITGPLFHCWNQAFLDCRLPWVFSKCKLFGWWGQCEGLWLLWPYHACVFSCLMSRFYGRDTIILRISALLSIIRFINCNLTLDVAVVKLMSQRFYGNWGSSVLFFLNSPSECIMISLFLSTLILTHCSSSFMVSSHDPCMLT